MLLKVASACPRQSRSRCCAWAATVEGWLQLLRPHREQEGIVALRHGMGWDWEEQQGAGWLHRGSDLKEAAALRNIATLQRNHSQRPFLTSCLKSVGSGRSRSSTHVMHLSNCTWAGAWTGMGVW